MGEYNVEVARGWMCSRTRSRKAHKKGAKQNWHNIKEGYLFGICHLRDL